MSVPNVDAAAFETSLRDQLIAAQRLPQPQDPDSAQDVGPPLFQADVRAPRGLAPQIDPSMDQGDHNADRGDQYDMDGMGMDEAYAAMANSQRPKGPPGPPRELSGTKRAAQNRAAQRAFRSRKEAYITKLEAQVKDLRVMEDDFKAVQHENYQLREYIISLQTRILETSSELPPPPPRVSLQDPTDPNRLPPPEDDRMHDVHDIHEQLQQPHLDANIHPQLQPAPLAHDPQLQQHDPQLQHDLLVPPAPMASMTGATIPANTEDDITRAALEQLQAAAAEAGVLGNEDQKLEV